MRENFVQSMENQVEAQTHEESKLWRASQPLPNQSSKQGRKSEKKSNSQQFRKPCEMPKEVQAAGQRARLWKMNLTTPYEIFISLAKPKLKKINFALCAKFRKHCEIFLCNLQIFLHQLCQIFISRYFVYFLLVIS